MFAPGLLVAATGVGAGDLLTASLAGARHGLTLLWAAGLGALLKWFLNEGIARWQMATESTLLAGWTRHLGRAVRWAFLIYLLPWAYFTGGALITACGVAGTGLLPIGGPQTSKVVWGVLHSLVGFVIVWRGGFRIFVRFMAVCTVAMVAAVLLSAILIQPDWGAVVHGLFVPHLPPGGTAYTLGVLGGVGGTVTLLSYGYWIRESGRTGLEGARTCRIDLAAGYTLTGLFGVAMIIIGSRVTLERGPTAALELASQLQLALGPIGKWIFLAGFWGAVFSSLLGVWQSVPYIFADFITLPKRAPGGLPDLKTTPAYRWFLIAIAIVPVLQLGITVERAQLLYAVMGALFMPFLALTLLLMNTRRRWMGDGFVSGWITNTALTATFVLFSYVGLGQVRDAVSRLLP